MTASPSMISLTIWWLGTTNDELKTPSNHQHRAVAGSSGDDNGFDRTTPGSLLAAPNLTGG
jgi:hypothetical protein